MTNIPPLPKIEPGYYRHFKDDIYQAYCVIQHTETLEPLVVCGRIGHQPDWGRPFSMWNEQVEVNGLTQPRFEKLTPSKVFSNERSQYLKSKFERAAKATQWSGWLYLDHLEESGGEGYFQSLEHLIDKHLDWIADEILEREKLPAFAWTCKKRFLRKVDVSEILELSAEYLDFNCDVVAVASKNSKAALEKALLEFYEANSHIAVYEPNYRLALLLDWDLIIEARNVCEEKS